MRWGVLFCLLPLPAFADAVVTNRIVKAGQVITADDLSTVEALIPEAETDLLQIVGQEARVALYPGRPIRKGQVGPPAVIKRNQVVSLTYIIETLFIQTEGRALAQGAVGDVIPIINLMSRKTVQGRVQPDGTVSVSPTEG